MEAYRDWKTHGRWPNSGGRWDQSAVLLDLFDELADQEQLPRYA